MPGDRRAPVVPDDIGLLLAQGLDQPHYVTDQMQDGVRPDVVGMVAESVSALVGGDDTEARVGQRAELVLPGMPGLREAVQEHHQRAVALLGDMQADAVHVNHAVLNHAHERTAA